MLKTFKIKIKGGLRINCLMNNGLNPQLFYFHKTSNCMKNSITFLLFLIAFNFIELKAQQSDSTAREILPLMKSKSQIFIAEIETNFGTQIGILYEADSSGIVILDSLYKKIEISILDIKVLTIRRMNAAGFGFNTGFKTFLIPTLILEVVWLAAGAASAYLGGLLLFYTAVAGLGFGLAFGGLMALASHNIPNIKINTEQWGNEYHRQLMYITRKTQKHFVSRFPKKVRLI
jgi:hypothetical protein